MMYYLSFVGSTFYMYLKYLNNLVHYNTKKMMVLINRIQYCQRRCNYVHVNVIFM